MGVDLGLLPIEEEASNELAISLAVLQCTRDYVLFDAIEKLPCRPAPVNLKSHLSRLPDGNTGWGTTKDTRYGKPVTCVTVEDLLQVKTLAVAHNNKAVWAYLAELPAHNLVALYWH